MNTGLSYRSLLQSNWKTAQLLLSDEPLLDGCSPEHRLGETCLHGYQLLLLPPLHQWLTIHCCSTLAWIDNSFATSVLFDVWWMWLWCTEINYSTFRRKKTNTMCFTWCIDTEGCWITMEEWKGNNKKTKEIELLHLWQEKTWSATRMVMSHCSLLWYRSSKSAPRPEAGSRTSASGPKLSLIMRKVIRESGQGKDLRCISIWRSLIQW